MVSFKAIIQKFGSKGEKSGWSYINVPAPVCRKLHPQDRRSFRVKGFIDQHPIEGIALLPIKDGKFILALNAGIRKAIRKKEGAMVDLKLEPDDSAPSIPQDLKECLHDDPVAEEYFNTLKMGERNYFIKWIESARTEPTRTKRLAMAINAFANKLDFGTMLRREKDKKF